MLGPNQLTGAIGHERQQQPEPIFGKPLRLMICAALAIAITGLTTQVIVSSAGQHEYGVASTQQPGQHLRRRIGRRMTVAQVR